MRQKKKPVLTSNQLTELRKLQGDILPGIKPPIICISLVLNGKGVFYLQVKEYKKERLLDFLSAKRYHYAQIQRSWENINEDAAIGLIQSLHLSCLITYDAASEFKIFISAFENTISNHIR